MRERAEDALERAPHLTDRPLRVARGPPDARHDHRDDEAEAGDDPDDRGEQDHVDDRHQHQGADQHHDPEDRLDERLDGDLAQQRGVRGHARQQVAGGLAAHPGHRQPQDVLDERSPALEHHRLGRAQDQEVAEAERQRGGHDERGELGQRLAEPLVDGQRLEHELRRQRLGEAQRARDHEQRAAERHPPPLGPQVAAERRQRLAQRQSVGGRRAHQATSASSLCGDVADAAEAQRQPGGDQRPRVVHELEVHVRLARVARVAAAADHVARAHPIAGADAGGAALEMGEDRIRAVAGVDHHVVAEHAARARDLARERLEDHVGDRRPGRAGQMVARPVVGGDDLAVDRREDVLAEGRELLGRRGTRDPCRTRAGRPCAARTRGRARRSGRARACRGSARARRARS